MSIISLALITRRVDSTTPLLRFISNARQHGHHIDRVILAYSHGVEEETVKALQRDVRMDLVCAHGDENIRKRLLAVGMGLDAINGLLDVPSWTHHSEAPYSAYRNAVLIKALLDGVDYLLFFDSDVLPVVLIDLKDEETTWKEIDFVGTHLTYLTQPDVLATTSDYSGYYIIPPMAFDGLEDLLVGLGKDQALDYVAECDKHGCLNFGPPTPGPAIPTDKLLGGNLGLKLHEPKKLAPFFSTVYVFQGQCIKGRGEDTLLGQALSVSESQMLDIDLRVFHDTFDGFPGKPDIRRKAVRDRFYHACLGWIGRNPFLTWFRAKMRRVEINFEEEMARQIEGITVGSNEAARYFEDPRFAELPAALDASLAALPRTIVRYERLVDGWADLINALTPDVLPSENAGEIVDRPPMAA